MKKLFPLLIVLISLCACNTTKTQTDLEKNDLGKGVRSVRIIMHEAAQEPDGLVVRGRKMWYGDNYELIFNENGMKTEMRKYRIDNVITDSIIYNYTDGRISGETIYWHGQLVRNNEYIWEKDKLKTVLRIDTAGMERSRTEYAYPDRKTEIITQYDEKGGISSTTTNIYDKGKVVDSFMDSKKYPLRLLTTYDKSGREESVISIDMDNGKEVLRTPFKFEYRFDDHGNWTEQIRFRGVEMEPDMVITREIEYYQ